MRYTMIRKKPTLDEIKKNFVDSASTNAELENNRQTKYINKYSLENVNIQWKSGSKCGKNLTINLSEIEWNTLHHHIMEYGSGNKARWIKYYIFKSIEQEIRQSNNAI